MHVQTHLNFVWQVLCKQSELLGMLFNWCEVGAMYTMNVIGWLTALSVEIVDPSKSCDQCRDSLHGMNTHELQNILQIVTFQNSWLHVCI